MKPVDRSEILPLGVYEQIRERFRARVIQEKRRRRVKLGDIISVVFENRDTVLLQIQEMLRTEQITREDAIEHEIVTYNDLVPADGQLSMTLFIEIPERERRERMLTALAGLEETVAMEINGERFAATAADRDGAEAGRTTAVQYYKVDLSEEAAAKLRDKRAGAVALAVEHAAYQQRSELSADVVAELASDLR